MEVSCPQPELTCQRGGLDTLQVDLPTPARPLDDSNVDPRPECHFTGHPEPGPFHSTVAVPDLQLLCEDALRLLLVLHVAATPGASLIKETAHSVCLLALQALLSRTDMADLAPKKEQTLFLPENI
ncbi:hypothetical protein HJG60_011858 [Phyllostomus discolor]|uniref:Uncharacterized protein n=1 Tax=Phyllostomus discolor TaxID=89673 RepID=A0A833ZNW0_9CHIR|nr:hypothetical protein HJG60_011858 [Phyllostomus discolor]